MYDISYIVRGSNGQWSVGDILNSTDLTTERYQHKYIQQLKLGRQQWEEQLRHKENLIQVKEEKLHLSHQQLEEKEKQLVQYQKTLHTQSQMIQSMKDTPQGILHMFIICNLLFLSVTDNKVEASTISEELSTESEYSQ